MAKVAGQAMLEGLVLMTLFTMIFVLIKDVIHPFNVAEQQRIDRSRDQIWRAGELPEGVIASADYPHATRAKLIVQPLTMLSGFELPLENMRQLQASRDFRPMVQLSDPWSPKSSAELSRRPAQLTLFARLNELGLPFLQRMLGALHFTEELAPDNLVFGYVNADATPAEVDCAEELPC